MGVVAEGLNLCPAVHCLSYFERSGSVDPGFTDVAVASEVLKPYDARLMRSYPVSTRINHAANDDAECAKPIELKAPPQGQLFC